MTTRGEAEKRIAALRDEIRRHEHLYYVLDQPAVSDQEYDALERELRDRWTLRTVAGERVFDSAVTHF